jgi:hypothetical protein
MKTWTKSEIIFPDLTKKKKKNWNHYDGLYVSCNKNLQKINLQNKSFVIVKQSKTKREKKKAYNEIKEITGK